MNKCPKCGSLAGVYWNDYGYKLLFNQKFSGSFETREVMQTTNKTRLPIYCRCLDCDKRFRIKDVESE